MPLGAVDELGSVRTKHRKAFLMRCCTFFLVAIHACWFNAMRKRTRENQPALADASNKTEHQSDDGLTQSQRLALEHVTASAKAAHSAAQASLQARLRSLGIAEEELVQRSSLLLAYVRSEAPLIVYVPYDVVTLLLSDPFLRSQFETMRSRGTLSAGTRMGWERAMFGGHYDSAPAAERPKYGCLNICA